MNVSRSNAGACAGLCLLLGCGNAVEPGGMLSVVSGNHQVGKVGAATGRAMVVRALRADGQAASGTRIDWTVVSGGGSVSPASSSAGNDGLANATYTMGPVAGVHMVRATIRDAADATVTFFLAAGSAPDPQLVASVEVQPLVHDTYVRDGIAFVNAWNTGGLRIYDVGNGMNGGSPAQPELVSALVMDRPETDGVQVHNAWWFWNPNTLERRYVFIGEESAGIIGQSSSGDIHVVDVSDLSNPRKVAAYHMAGTAQPAGAHNFWMDEAAEILYAAFYNGGVVALDVSGTLSGDLAAREIARVNPAGGQATYVWGVQLHNGSLYVADFLNGFSQLRLTGGAFSVLSGSANVTERYTSDLWVHGSHAYTGTWGGSSGRNGRLGNVVKVWQLDGTGAPSLVDSIVLGDVATISDVEVTADGKALVLSTERELAGGIYVYGLADPAHPSFLSRHTSARGYHTATVADINGRRYVFAAKNSTTAQGDAALQVLDITEVVP